MYSQEAVMLTLAAISYRGFNLILESDRERTKRLRQAMTECLDTLAPVKDQWNMVWGPANFHPLPGGLDEAGMYVVQNRVDKSRFVVAIRGTNPISISDWVKGDFTVTQTVDWPYGSAPGARISLATAHGLSILQNLRSALSGTTSIASSPNFSIGQQVRQAVSTLIANTQNRLRESRLNPLLMSSGDVHPGNSNGSDLRTFLIGVLRDTRGPIELNVTGHSKGGTLSSTFALWLADTQGEGVAPDDQWDPTNRVTVNCYSFAGPTAGDRLFANHSNAVIGNRCWRIFNTNDIPPHVWNTNDISQIPGIYSSDRVTHEVLNLACQDVANRVSSIGYQQIGNQLHSFAGAMASGNPFPEQAVHQHLEAYFEELGLSNDMNLFTFFGPIA